MGTEDRNHQRVAEMSLKAALAPLLLCLVSGAPQPHDHSVSCRTEYTQVWDTQYQEKETQECVTNYEKVCHTVNERLCKPTTREDCEFQWEGYGNNKVWAKIPGTCKQNPYDKCQDATKSKAKQVAYPVCNDVPEQKCVDVPRQHCRQIPDQVCTNQPLQQCENVPRQQCTKKHKKVPVRISKNIPKKVCDTTGTGYGYSSSSSAQQPTNPEVLDIGRANPNTNLLKNNKIIFADK